MFENHVVHSVQVMFMEAKVDGLHVREDLSYKIRYRNNFKKTILSVDQKELKSDPGQNQTTNILKSVIDLNMRSLLSKIQEIEVFMFNLKPSAISGAQLKNCHIL